MDENVLTVIAVLKSGSTLAVESEVAEGVFWIIKLKFEFSLIFV